MRKTVLTTTLAAALGAFALVSAGCQDTPQSVRTVDQSVLPAPAKAMFSQDTQITKVEEVRYSKGAKQYRIHYVSPGGREKVIQYSDASETTPTGVFEHAVH